MTSKAQVYLAGKVSNKKGNAIAYPELLLRSDIDSTVIKTDLGDSLGNFIITIDSFVSCKLLVRAEGYIENCLILNNVNDLSKIGSVEMDTNRNFELKGITVSGSKRMIERKIDRIVFNVDKSIAATGTDAFTLVGKAPNVKIVNNQINMLGKGAVKILINDKLLILGGDDLSNYLKSIPSENVGSIEIIPNPPANYDAAGNYGLINIITKKNKTEGLSALLKAASGQATYLNASGGVNVYYLKNKVNIQSSISGNNGAYGPIERAETNYPTQIWKRNDYRKDIQNNMRGQVDMDYKPNATNTLSLTYAISQSKPDIIERINTNVYSLMQNLDSQINTSAFTDAKNVSNIANIHFQHKLDSNEAQIVLDGDFGQFNTDKSRIFDNYTLQNDTNKTNISNYLSENTQRIRLYSLNAYSDFSIKKYSLSIGGKISLLENKSRFGLYQLSSGSTNVISSNQFDYIELNKAAFISIQRTFHKIETKIGIRYENAEIKGSSLNGAGVSYQTNNIFPTVYLSYNLNDNNTFGINLGRRIDRPEYYALNPFRWYFNEYAYSEGNPFLKPSYSNNVELSYTNASNLNISVSFSVAQNVINQFTYLSDSSNIQATKYLNLSNDKALSVGASYTFTQIKWLESNWQLQGVFNKNTALIREAVPNIQSWGLAAAISNLLYLNKRKNIIGNIDFEYLSTQAGSLGTQRYSSRLDIGIKVLALKKQLTIALACSDVFKTDVGVFKTYSNSILDQTNNYYDLRVLKLSASYKIGKRQKAIEQKDSQVEAERNRVGF
ncbi:MAG: outer membrane beta-barrel family protein [Phycisphaerales bacterium]|nr:outer membrane beta-barrel family protein [Phycisphaerales bacterium]